MTDEVYYCFRAIREDREALKKSCKAGRNSKKLQFLIGRSDIGITLIVLTKNGVHYLQVVSSFFMA